MSELHIPKRNNTRIEGATNNINIEVANITKEKKSSSYYNAQITKLKELM